MSLNRFALTKLCLNVFAKSKKVMSHYRGSEMPGYLSIANANVTYKLVALLKIKCIFLMFLILFQGYIGLKIKKSE